MIKVYYIGDEVVEKQNIGNVELNNIVKIFESLLGDDLNGTNEDRYQYYIDNDDHFLKKFSDNYFQNGVNIGDFVFADIANRLLEAELVDDGTRRNKKIKQGILFEYYQDQKLIFLKLEQMESIDQETFEMREGYSIDKKYYKGMIYTGNPENIIVIDKTGKVANYWSESFLGLLRSRDNKANTEEIVKFIKKKQFFREGLDEESYYYRKLIGFVKNSRGFDYETIFTYLGLLSEDDTTDSLKQRYIDDTVVKKLDAQFDFTYEEKSKLFDVELNPSEFMKIRVSDLSEAADRRDIYIENGNLIIPIEEGKLENITRKLFEYDEK
ncbi:MAG: hypothetical protein RR565_02735 [Erysipelothrix sp.]